MKNLKERGITLIALVITIIVLLILAGVTISIAMKTGIMDKAEKAVDMYSEEEALEQLKLALLDYRAGKIVKENKELIDYIHEIDKNGTIEEDDDIYVITILGHEFEVEILEKRNGVVITGEISKGGETRISKVDISNEGTEGKIDVTVTSRNYLPTDKIVISYRKTTVGGSYGNSVSYDATKLVFRSITGLELGEKYDIYVEIVNNDGSSKTPKVYKEYPNITAGVIHVQDITITETELDIIEEEEKTISATVVPSNASEAIIWSSDNENIATVDENGKVTGISTGVCNISVSAGSITKTVSVSVHEGIVIFNQGWVNTEFTGGLEEIGSSEGMGEVKSDVIYLLAENNTWQSAGVVTKNKMNFNDYDQIILTITTQGGDGYMYNGVQYQGACVGVMDDTAWGAKFLEYETINGFKENYCDICINTSTWTETGYFRIQVSCGRYLNISKIVLRKSI